MKDFAQPASFWTALRRWLGIYTKDERQHLQYNARLKNYSEAVFMGVEILTARPDWMDYEDYITLRSQVKQLKRNKR